MLFSPPTKDQGPGPSSLALLTLAAARQAACPETALVTKTSLTMSLLRIAPHQGDAHDAREGTRGTSCATLESLNLDEGQKDGQGR
jgi:hypothetical protein